MCFQWYRHYVTIACWRWLFVSCLQTRIKELIQEKAQLKRKQKELRREHIQLHRDRKAKEQRIAELEARAYDVQMLKFGMLIDLDVLDRMGSNKGVEDLKESLRQQERAHAAELAEWTRKIEEARVSVVDDSDTVCSAFILGGFWYACDASDSAWRF